MNIIKDKSPWNLLRLAWRIFINNFWIIFIAGVLFQGLQYIEHRYDAYLDGHPFLVLSLKGTRSFYDLLLVYSVSILLNILQIITIVFLTLFFIYLTKDSLSQKKIQFNILFKKSIQKLKTGVLSVFLNGLIFVILMIFVSHLFQNLISKNFIFIAILFLIMIVIMLVGFVFNLQAIALRNKSAIGALKYIWSLLKKRRLKLMMYLLAPVLILISFLAFNMLIAKFILGTNIMILIIIGQMIFLNLLYGFVIVYQTLVFINFDNNKAKTQGLKFKKISQKKWPS